MNIKRRIVEAAVLTVLISGANQLLGQDVVWDGSQNAQWSQKKNWTPEGTPGATNTVGFGAKGSIVNPTVDSAQSVQGVVFSGTGGWTIGAGNTLTVGSGGIDQTGSGINTVAAATALNGSSTWTVSSGTLVISGAIGGGANALTKNGAGVLRLSASNSYTGGTIIDAGTLQFATAGNRLSTSGSIKVNGGSFDLGGFSQSTSRDVTITGGIVTNGTLTKTTGNFAAQSGTASATLAGAAGMIKTTAGTMLLSASNSYSGGTTVNEGTLQFGTAGNRLNTSGSITVNGGTLNLGGFSQSTSGNVTIAGGTVSNGTLTKVGGNFSAQSGSVASTGILAGTGVGLQKTTASTFTLNGNHTYTGATTVTEGTLIVNGSIANSSGVQIASDATLGGHGIVSAISGAGTVSPGESPAILTATSVDGSDGLDFHFEFTLAAIAGVSTPDFLSPENSGNDLLRLTDATTPFSFGLDSDNRITVDFSLVSLNMGDRYLGGFFTQTDALSLISGADFNYLGLGEYSVSISMIEWSADFGAGNVDGFITQFEVIPEPHTFAFLAISTLGMAIVLRKRKRLNFE